MRKSAVLLLPLAATALFSCSGSNSSSSSSSHAPTPTPAPSSSSEPPKPAGRLLIQANSLTAHAKTDFEGVEMDFKAEADNLCIDARTNTPPESLATLLDYLYYQDSEILGEATLDRAALITAQGHSTNTSEYTGPIEIGFASKEGNLYADLSWFEEELGNPENGCKYLIEDAFSFLNEETFTDVASVLSMIRIDGNELLAHADESEVLTEAMHATSTEEGLKLTIDINSEVLTEIAAMFKTDVDKAELQAQIESYVPRMEDAQLTTFLDMKTGSFDTLMLSGLFGLPDFEATIEEETFLLSDVYFDIDASIHWEGADAFELPDLSDYHPFEVPVSSQE